LLSWVYPPPPCVARAVLVTLKSEEDSALRGVLWQTRGPWFVLRNVFLVREDREVRMDGEVIVHLDNVTFLQVLHGSE
jgi:hypothetical protein